MQVRSVHWAEMVKCDRPIASIRFIPAVGKVVQGAFFM